MGTRIRIKTKRRRTFQMRIAGLGFRHGHVLVHRATHEAFWTFPGGGAEIGETSQETLDREMMEELGVTVEVGRLLWMVENFFHYEGRDWHELGLYYLMQLPDSFPFAPQGIIHTVQDGDSELEFKWVAATRQALTALDIPPYFIAAEIENLPDLPRHLVWDDRDLDGKPPIRTEPA
ncbi:NUDIX hydrolase [Rhizobium sp. SSA_523]|uniref:NUDIX hydrolase n=1 Tax=Rhizobium sp. SSA_523 TaxID=2952477 RepID=UPI002090AC21|nr:NUDIX hydrolase [Rhizobium sp. SSA_523]MCO5731998.1 NUDIX hydrolase [Rhizobium sp. SSA_523]WKC22660.1 NUDIX hydrolase [Rhizobium sp. SSA_523]